MSIFVNASVEASTARIRLLPFLKPPKESHEPS